MAEATVEEIVQAVKEAVDERFGSIEERLAKLEGGSGANEGSGGETGEGETQPTGEHLDEGSIKELIKSEVEEATKALKEKTEALEEENDELKEGIEKILGASKAINDEPEGGDKKPATKSSTRRDAFGRRERVRS